LGFEVPSLCSQLANNIKLIAKASVASALLALSVSGGHAEAQSLSAVQQISISGSAEFGLEYGESFNVSAQEIQQADDSTSGAVNFKPFETTVGSSFANINGQPIGQLTQGDPPSVVGNAGQSSLTLTYDRTGFLPIQEVTDSSTTPQTTENVKGDGSITALAGITPFGGDQLAGGLSLTNVPSNIRLNQDLTTGLPGIEFTEFASTGSAGSSVNQNGASITSTLTGARAVTASVFTQSNIMNSLTSAFD